jgi:hypothetical protein
VDAGFSLFSGRNVALRSKLFGDRYHTEFHQSFTGNLPAGSLSPYRKSKTDANNGVRQRLM